MKAPKAITHEAALRCKKKDLLEFIEQIRGMGCKLGPILFQLPPSLALESKVVKQFFTLVRDAYGGDVVFEPRHASWFTRAANGLLKQFKIARAGADPACVPQAAIPAESGNVVYFRLHGSPRKYYSSYDDQFLSSLAATLAGLSPMTEAWCIFDNTASGAALGNALALQQKLPAAR